MSHLFQTQKKSGIIIIFLAAFTLCLCGFIVFRFFRQKPRNIQPIELDSSLYQEAKLIDIDREGYQKLLTEKKSFVLMVDNPGCITTAEMRKNMENFSEDMQFSYYRIYWSETESTNIRSYIKYFPSIIIIDHGQISSFLRADSDQDAIYYNDGSELQKWLRIRVKPNLSDNEK